MSIHLQNLNDGKQKELDSKDDNSDKVDRMMFIREKVEESQFWEVKRKIMYHWAQIAESSRNLQTRSEYFEQWAELSETYILKQSNIELLWTKHIANRK